MGSEVVFRLSLVAPLVRACDFFLRTGGTLYLLSSAERGGFLLLFHLLLQLGYSVSSQLVNASGAADICVTQPEELSVSWFCDEQFKEDFDHLILLTCVKPVKPLNTA